MDWILVGLQLLALLGIGSLFLFRKYLFSYSSEKGKNLATKEDVEEITRKVEGVKVEYVAEIERLKVDLSLFSRKNTILLDEKIRVFKRLQKRLVDFKKYCEAALGEYDERGEFHPNLQGLAEDVDKAALQHITALHEIEQEDFIFLSKKSRKILADLHHNCSMMCSMEIAIFSEESGSEMAKSSIPLYESAISNIDICLQSLYEELEFPSVGEQR
ncbi:hypothetical protein L861_17590 [Litchfieldella anticariensis FP35 = DSM 16096]|uniref:Uncharacterized protein n=1 Tax=Litchfieldella anticariensis (strain DSM 16096 / CECT 5854 / CIP 108499 / LMG 22089 / FP35) TaxID=1121939 RepID=S2KN44_LITA3|nr:hypothetical protein [Halomonas anticariensis]EPC03355.1 hypothetical protein L861_17590 [Halomonas anticariensis FP35 = DSM 16096]